MNRSPTHAPTCEFWSQEVDSKHLSRMMLGAEYTAAQELVHVLFAPFVFRSLYLPGFGAFAQSFVILSCLRVWNVTSQELSCTCSHPLDVFLPNRELCVQAHGLNKCAQRRVQAHRLRVKPTCCRKAPPRTKICRTPCAQQIALQYIRKRVGDRLHMERTKSLFCTDQYT